MQILRLTAFLFVSAGVAPRVENEALQEKDILKRYSSFLGREKDA